MAAILDANGQSVVKYTYDAWGKVVSITGSLADTIGQLNPMRYRGYYYDNESGYYYLQSRYYDSETGRFLNADDSAILPVTKSDAVGHNLFAYCGNNPVNLVDKSGKFGTPLQWAMAAIGGIAGWFFGDYVAKQLGYNRGWKYWAIRTGVVVGGAVIGWFVGTAIVNIATRFLLANPSILAKIPGPVLAILGLNPDISNKLLYVFGQATGNSHNIIRSAQMLNQLKRIGIFDSPYWRSYVTRQIITMFNNPTCFNLQADGRIVREAILSGPSGNLKIVTIWEGVKLITINLFG